jgi:hypothetical protein
MPLYPFSVEVKEDDSTVKDIKGFTVEKDFDLIVAKKN